MYRLQLYHYFSVIIALVVTTLSAEDVQMPEGTQRCRIADPERDACLRNALQDMIPKLYGGSTALNIPPIEPLVLNHTHFEYHRGPLHGSLHIRSATIHGLTRSQVQAVRTRIDAAGMDVELDVFHPRVQIEGAYKAEGEFNGARMNARGDFNVTFKRVSTAVQMRGEFVDAAADGERYMHISAFDADVSMDSMRVSATGIFDDPTLNQLALEFINQNWPSIYKRMIPETKDIWEPRMIAEMNAFLMRVPFRMLLE